ncbi:MAG: hypothetical protein AAF721_14990 [Myxococcota bacterium]
MEPVRPLTARGHELLAGYRARTPGEARTRSNWAGVQNKLTAPADDTPPPDVEDSAVWIANRTRGRRWSQTAKAVAATFAIAAAVLLLIRGAWTGARALVSAESDVRTQASDQAGSEADAGAWRRGTPPAAPSTRPETTDSPGGEALVIERAPSDSGPTAPTPRQPRPAPTPDGEPAPASGPDVDGDSALAEQTRLLVAARAALSERRFADALRLSRDYRRRFPQGVLLEEQMAIEAMAECGMEGERPSAPAFLAAYPSSPHAPRVRAACRVAQ